MARATTGEIGNDNNAFCGFPRNRLKLSSVGGRLFAIRRKIFVHGVVIVDRQGRANFVSTEPLSFWSFFDVFASLAVIAGVMTAVLT